jgi:Cu/Ag efflux pump CusA
VQARESRGGEAPEPEPSLLDDAVPEMKSAVVGANPRLGRLAMAVAVGILLLGITQLGSARVDFLPEFMPPSVQVQTEALGLSAAEVEQLITVPLEQDLLNGVPWLDRIHSRSQPGLSAIDIVFEPGTDIYAARQMVQERLTQAHALPNVGSPAIMVEPLASVSRVAMIGLTSKSVSLIDMSVLARWKIRPRLMGIPGVANVSVYGLRDRQLQVQVDPAKLGKADVSLTQVIETAGNALWVSPLTFVEASTPGTGGFIEGRNQRLAVQHVLPITTAGSLGQVSIEGTTTPTRLGDVTNVVEDHQPLIGDAVDATPALFLVIQKFPDADTMAVTREVEDAMASLQAGLAGIDSDMSVYRPASFLDSARHTIGLAGALGLALLVVTAMLLFWSWRAALVIGASVALSTTASLYLLYLRDMTLTTMTLAGLVVALVLMIAVVAGDVDAVRLRFRAAGVRESATAREVVVEAMAQSQGNAVLVMLVGALALTPLLLLDPTSTALTRPMVITFVVAVVVALVVGLAVTPALVLLVMGRRAPAARRTPAFLHWLTARVSGVVTRFALARTLAWAAVGVLLVASLAAIPQWSQRSLVPSARETNLLLHVETAEGTSLTEMNRVAGLMAAELRTVHGVQSVGGHVGRAVTSDQLGDVNAGELWISIADSSDYRSARSAVNRIAAGYPGVRTELSTYSADQVGAARTGRDQDLVVRVLGQDLRALQRTAQEVATSLSAVAGVRSPHVAATPTQPTVRVEVNLAAAERHGLRPGDIRREATTLASGLTVGNLYEQAKVFDVVVLGTPTTRANLSDLQDLKVDTPSGTQVRLGDVAKVSIAAEPASIVHDQVMRSVDVVADISGRDAASVVADVRGAVARVPMPSEAHLQVLSNALDRQTDLRRVAIAALAVLLGILLVLQAATGRWRQAVALLLLAPLGGVGAVLVAPLVGGFRATGPLLGLFAAALLTLLGGLAFARGHAVTAARQPSALAGAARARVAPVLRAALLTAMAFVPAALLGERAGSELLQPFAVTLLGGVVSSVVVVLCIVPALCGLPKGADR